MSKIVNLTQHPATPEQVEQGVVEPADKQKVRQLLTFEELPDKWELKTRAIDLSRIAVNHGIGEGSFYSEELTSEFRGYALIGGAPYLMSTLEKELRKRGIIPLYAFSIRVSEEKQNPDGSTTKTQVFKHLGFVEP